jgi:NADPH-dependent ferric siderophore reductase
VPAPETITAAIAWKPSATDRLLIAGDEAALPAIETLVATLPATARGQVFVEVGSEADVAPLATPGRVMVCWLIRDRGQSLHRSVDAWLSEMLPVDWRAEHSVYAWIAGEGAARTISSN